jgi:hypothetical protein
MATRRRILKRDHFGTVTLHTDGPAPVVIRDTGAARPWLRWLARRLAAREAAALVRLAGRPDVPALIAVDGARLTRSFLPGTPMHVARPASTQYFRSALRLLIRLHRDGVAHNDLAKEANWLELANGDPAVVDFQIATISSRRGWLFRRLAREDLRHLLKHKRHYLPDTITQRQRAILHSPSAAARAWRALVKPVYRCVTRRLLRWPERRGAAERENW